MHPDDAVAIREDWVRQTGLTQPVYITLAAMASHGTQLAAKFQITALLSDVRRASTVLGAPGMGAIHLPEYEGLIVQAEMGGYVVRAA